MENEADDIGDSTGADGNSQKGVLNNVANAYPSPKLVLQHSTVDTAADSTWYGVYRLRDAGYQMVAVDTCLGGAGMSFPSITKGL